MRFGKIKFYAHRARTVHYSDRIRGVERDGRPFNISFKAYEPVPLFRDNRVNRAIDAHEARIDRALTRRRRPGPNSGEWA